MTREPPAGEYELSELERAKIRAEARYALLAAREIHQDDAPKSSLDKALAYLSNGFVLLLIGSLFTAWLVPSFQRRYDNRKQQVALMQECLAEFLLYSNSLWQEYYAILPLTQRSEIDETTYFQYTEKMAQIKLKRYDAYAKVLALLVVFQDETGSKPAPSIEAALKHYAVSLNEASAAIDRWLTALYCTPTDRGESPCSAGFDLDFQAFDEYLKIKEMVVNLGNGGTDDVAAMIVKRISRQ